MDGATGVFSRQNNHLKISLKNPYFLHIITDNNIYITLSLVVTGYLSIRSA